MATYMGKRPLYEKSDFEIEGDIEVVVQSVAKTVNDLVAVLGAESVDWSAAYDLALSLTRFDGLLRTKLMEMRARKGNRE